MMFVVKNRDIFDLNGDCYKINTRQHMNMHLHQVNLAKYGNGVYHMAVKIFSGLRNYYK
jgi:hypothetical protein